MPWIGITSDNEGLVRPCCKFAEKVNQDQYPTGSLKENTYEEIWNGSDPRFKSLIYFMTSDISRGTNFIKETEFLDRIRKESFRDVYPEWSELIYAYM